MLRRIGPHGTYYNADRTIVASPVPAGAFRPGAGGALLAPRPPAAVPRGRGTTAPWPRPSPRSRRTGGATRWRGCTRVRLRLRAGDPQAPLARAERARCLAEVARWLWQLSRPGDRRAVGRCSEPDDASRVRSSGADRCGWRRTATSAWATSATRAPSRRSWPTCARPTRRRRSLLRGRPRGRAPRARRPRDPADGLRAAPGAVASGSARRRRPAGRGTCRARSG